MLWTDRLAVTPEELAGLDPECADVSITEDIILTGGNGIIQRAKVDCQGKLSRFMSFAGLSPTDLTVRNVNLPLTMPDLRFNYAGLEQIVVTGDSDSSWSPLKNWVANCTLLRFYRAAINKNADRYSDKYDMLEKLIRDEYWPEFQKRGIPIVFDPLSCPGAENVRAGLFTEANVTLVAGAGTRTDAVEYAITWVGSHYTSPTAKNNGESDRSARVSLTMTNGSVASISILGLKAPNGTQPDFTMASARYSTGIAVGWNVWAGLPGGIMFRQNNAVLPLSQTSFDLPGNPVFSGEQLGYGQFENIVLEISATELVRGD